MNSSVEHDDRSPIQPAASDAARAMLDAWSAPAFLVQPKSASLLAANSAGLRLFPTLPAALDAAMPAVQTLRQIARDKTASVTNVALAFWTPHGMEGLVCDVMRVQNASAQPLLLIRALTEPPLQAPATDASPPPHTPSDEIRPRHVAQAIPDREQHFHRDQPPAPVPASEDVSPETSERAFANETPRGIDLAKLAHELKTPVSAIAAASEIMKDGRFGAIENQRYAEYIEGIHASACHALDLIDRMLDRRTEDTSPSSATFRFETVDLNDIVAACIATTQPLASAKGLALSSSPSATKPTVMADPTALKQIVLNLLTNAIKFTASGGKIAVMTVGSRRGAAAVTVEDTGPGMTAVTIAEALRPVPLEISSTREGGGLGLGLPMSRALAEANGATLSIDSTPGRGTRVTLAFPGGPLVAI